MEHNHNQTEIGDEHTRQIWIGFIGLVRELIEIWDLKVFDMLLLLILLVSDGLSDVLHSGKAHQRAWWVARKEQGSR